VESKGNSGYVHGLRSLQHDYAEQFYSCLVTADEFLDHLQLFFQLYRLYSIEW